MTAADSDVRSPAPHAGASRIHRASEAGSRRGLYWAAIVSAVVAILCALALPFAPVSVNDPVVSWPEYPSDPTSTSLLLNAYEPRSLDVRIDCSAVRAAADSGNGLVFATMQPESPDARALGLVATAEDGRFSITSTGSVLLDQPIPSGDCSYRIVGDAGGTTVTRAGDPVEGGSVGRLPDIDVLMTSLDASADLEEGALSATVRVADPFAHRPATTKIALLLVLGLAAAVSLSTLAGLRTPGDRRKSTGADGASSRRRLLPRPVDVLVVAVLLAWLFLAPATDDDGYYSAMARNVEHEGYVAQYYQLRNQSFTPFTWFYYALAKWQTLGLSPVVLRVPALAAGLATYILLRIFVSGWRARSAAEDGRRWPTSGAVARGVLAVTFLAWWLPYDMSVRPESMVPALSAGVLVAASSAVRRNSLPRTALALALAAVSCTVHPTGFVALAPLLVTAAGLWKVVRGNEGTLGTAARLGAVFAAPIALASTLAFLDGTFYDFVRSQEIFLSIQAQNTWYEEIARYGLLLDQIAMGSYAKRAAVLLGLLCLVWFAVLASAARAGTVRLAPELRLAGWSVALGFTLLLITPSKWTHHFGSLAGLGPVFVTLLLVSAPAVTRRLTEGRRPAAPVILAALGSVAAVSALSLHGPNIWAYSWMIGIPQAFEIPHLPGVGTRLDSLLLWLAAAAALTAVVWWVTSNRARTWRPFAGVLAAPMLAVAMLTVVLGYLLGGFGYAAASTWNDWSPQASNIQDPLAGDCSAGGAVQAGDDTTAEPLPVAVPAAEGDTGFFTEDGFFPLSPPPAAIARTGVLGSLSGPGSPELGDASPEASIGSATSAWYVLPDELPDDEVLVAMGAGRLEGSNSLEVEYGSMAADGTVEVVRTEPLVDGADTPAWRSFPVRTGEQVAEGADVVRLVARDGSTGRGGWLAFSPPTVQQLVRLQDLIGNSPTAVSWQFAFNFPCAAQPVIRDGITQPVEYGIVWGGQGVSGLDDNTFAEPRGGLFGQLDRSAGVVRLFARVEGRPDIQLLQVYRFIQPLPERAYDLERTRQTVSGLAGPN